MQTLETLEKHTDTYEYFLRHLSDQISSKFMENVTAEADLIAHLHRKITAK